MFRGFHPVWPQPKQSGSPLRLPGTGERPYISAVGDRWPWPQAATQHQKRAFREASRQVRQRRSVTVTKHCDGSQNTKVTVTTVFAVTVVQCLVIPQISGWTKSMGAQSASFRREVLDTFCVQAKKNPQAEARGWGWLWPATEVLRD